MSGSIVNLLLLFWGVRPDIYIGALVISLFEVIIAE
jgi:hypothetical protein